MRNPFVCKVGGVVSADIAVTEHESETEFYSRVLTTGESPLWREDLMNNFGTPIIGLGARTAEYSQIPMQWMPHIQVEDVAASVACAVEKGGQELMHGKTDEGQSLWACLVDPFGAAFGIIPAVTSDEAGIADERCGRISWLSLFVKDVVSAGEFYSQVIGWKVKPVETGEAQSEPTKVEMQLDADFIAAEINQSKSVDQVISSTWIIHVAVDDLEESVQRASQLGGELIQKFSDSKSAILRDPEGVVFGLQSG